MTPQEKLRSAAQKYLESQGMPQNEYDALKKKNIEAVLQKAEKICLQEEAKKPRFEAGPEGIKDRRPPR